MKHLYRFSLSLFLLIISGISATAQPIVNGDAVATCYSGGSPTGYVAGIIKVQNADLQPLNANWAPPMNHGTGANILNRQNLGDVFGIAFDNAGNFYLSASTAYSASTPGGPGGSGAVYKVDGVTGMISVFTGTLNAACGSVTGTSTIPNTGPGLGNIAYDLQNNQFFVTNMEDGMIYRLNSSGVIQSTFDPFGADGCTSGTAPAGERLWGIGVYNNKVYFSRWYEDCGSPSNIVDNEIWSVDLDGSGDFLGSEQLEISIPPLPGAVHSNPVADIAFSAAGRMLIAERTMKGASANPLFPNAHASRVLEYILVGTVWTASTNIFSIGVPGPSSGCGSFPTIGANAAGGTDYTYGSFDSDAREPLDCDSAIWASGDYLHGWPELIYGLQRTPASGGLATGSVFIDLDGNTSSGQKTQIGDIEVFKKCKDQIQVPPCEEISYKVIHLPTDPTTNDCCVKIEFVNNAPPNTFYSIGANVITSGVSITGVIGPSGWGVTNSGTMATWSPISGSIPVGSNDSLIFCVFTTVPFPQYVEMVAYANDGSVCRDTIALDCEQQQPPEPVCFSIDTTDLECGEVNSSGNSFNYSIQITNNSTFSGSPYFLPAENIMAGSATPGVYITPNNVNFPPLGFGQTSGWLNFTISGPAAVPGATICIDFQLHGAFYNEDYQWCCPPETVCFTLPECRDCCERFDKDIKLDKIRSFSNGIASLDLSISAGPSPIIKTTATVVSVARKGFGFGNCSPSTWTQVHGYITNPVASFGGLPIDPTVQPYAYPPPGPYNEVIWGTVPSGVAMSGTPLNLKIQFPNPPSSFFCRDSLRFCVRYSFTDTNCVTCDTLVCYELVRKGKVIIDHVGDVFGTGKMVMIEMMDDKDGDLIFDIPEAEAGSDPLDEYRITGIRIQPEAGIELLSMSDENGNDVPVTDGYARLKVNMTQGNQYKMPLKFENSGGHRLFRVDIMYTYDFPNEKTGEEFEAEASVMARVPLPDGSGTDTLDTDMETELPKDVRTYALYFSNSNLTGDNISGILIRPKNDTKILAVGPPYDAGSITMSVYSDASGRVLLDADMHSELEKTVVMPGESIRPIYLTVSGATDDMIELDYETVNDNGDIVSSSEVSLSDPVHSSIPDINGGNSSNAYQFGYELLPVYPNPVVSTVTIQFSLIKRVDNMSLKLVDPTGRLITEIFTGDSFASGEHAVVLGTSGLSDGTYYLTLSGNGHSQTRALKVIK